MLLKLVDSESFRPTKALLEQYRQPFARAGFDVAKLKTREQWLEAADATFALQMRELASTERGKDPELDRILKGMPGWE